jgi:hypothetical protein
MRLRTVRLRRVSPRIKRLIAHTLSAGLLLGQNLSYDEQGEVPHVVRFSTVETLGMASSNSSLSFSVGVRPNFSSALSDM